MYMSSVGIPVSKSDPTGPRRELYAEFVLTLNHSYAERKCKRICRDHVVHGLNLACLWSGIQCIGRRLRTVTRFTAISVGFRGCVGHGTDILAVMGDLGRARMRELKCRNPLKDVKPALRSEHDCFREACTKDSKMAPYLLVTLPGAEPYAEVAADRTTRASCRSKDAPMVPHLHVSASYYPVCALQERWWANYFD